MLSSDLLIRYERGGQDISSLIHEAEGDWRVFRELEYEVIERASRVDEVIMDLGGGAVVDLDEDGQEIYSPRKVEAMRRHGFVVWLDGDLRRLCKRVGEDPTRPELSVTESSLVLMQRRLPWYAEAADIRVVINKRKKKDITKEILERIPFDPYLGRA